MAIRQSNRRRARITPDRRNQELLRSLRGLLGQRDRRAILREATAMLKRALEPESVWITQLGPLDGSRRVIARAGSTSILGRLTESAEFRRVLSTAFRYKHPVMFSDLARPGRGNSQRAVLGGSYGRVIICRIDGVRHPYGALTVRARPGALFGSAEAKLVDGVAAVLSALLGRLEKEARVRVTLSQYRQLVERGDEVMFLATVRPRLRIRYISPGIELLTGYRPSDFYDKPGLIERVVHPDDLPVVRADLAQPERLTGRLWIRLMGRDRRPAWVSVSRSPIHDARGTVIAVQGSLGPAWDQVVEREALRSRAEATAAILQGRRLNGALLMIVRHLRYLLEADEVLVAADRGRKGALQILCRDGIDRGGPQDIQKIRRDPLVRQALRTGRPVVRGGELVMIIPWSSDRNGLLIGRGLAGGDGDRGQATASADRFAHEIATAVESMRLDKERVRKAIGADRSRIARELHDGVVQTLFAVAFRLQLHADEVPESLRPTIQQTSAGIREAINDIQQYVRGLEPSLVMLGGLAASLEQLAVDFETSSGIPVSVKLAPNAVAALESVATDIVQIVREALSNVRRHARARRVALMVQEAAHATVLEVRDDGQGFSLEAAQGLGLRNLRTRARLLGGHLELHSEPGKGSLVRLVIPEPQHRPESPESLPA
jgi:signal transduction histidine kinase